MRDTAAFALEVDNSGRWRLDVQRAALD